MKFTEVRFESGIYLLGQTQKLDMEISIMTWVEVEEKEVVE